MASSTSDGWDWPYIVYVGRTWLRYSTEELWKLTPRQFVSQLNVHLDLQSKMFGGSSGKNQEPQAIGYIDEIKGW